jgi:uncharacterized protein YggE
MKTSQLRIAAIVVLVVAIVGGACGTDQAGTEGAGSDARSVTVSGEGRVSRPPDIVRMTLGVDIARPELSEAQATATETMTTIVAALQAHGVASNDVQTDTYAIYLDRDSSKADQPVTGYHVIHTVTATIRDIEQAGAVLAAAVDAGANTVHGVSFALEDDRSAITEARALAVADAQSKAEDLARLTHAKLGSVKLIGENVASSSPSSGAEDAAGRGAVVPVNPGQTVVSVSVTITWALSGD